MERFRLTALSLTAEEHLRSSDVDDESRELALKVGMEVLGCNQAQRCSTEVVLNSVDELAASSGASKEEADSMKEELHASIRELDASIA